MNLGTSGKLNTISMSKFIQLMLACLSKGNKILLTIYLRFATYHIIFHLLGEKCRNEMFWICFCSAPKGTGHSGSL